MSTPSTATTVIAPHHHGSGHYGYVHRPAAYSAQPSPLEPSFASPARLSTTHQNYPSLSQHSRNSTASRQLAAVEFSPVEHYQQQYQQQQQQQQQQQHSHHLSTPVMSRRLQRKPNWREFYKNGIPKEIIVIDDDDEEEEDGSDPLQAQPAAPGTTAVRRSLAHAETTSTTADGPATKKRRTNQAYQVAASSRDKPSYSNHNTPRYDNSASGTISTDRSAELHTTAPTSLGSNGSSRSYVEPAATGQKRKRVTRQQTGADQKKKKREELAAHKSHLEYKAPTRIRKQKDDVKVRVEPDRHHGAQHKHDDDDGHYVIVDAAQLTERYQIRRLLGQGTFGKVVEAYDRQKRSMCAIKIIRSVQKYRDASRIELRVLSTLAHNDSENRNKCIHLRDCFDFRNHICIVTDLYGQSVFDFLKANSFVPFPSSQIQSFARQLFTSVAFLHDLDLIHTDLKPENILLVSNAYQTFTYNRQIPSSSMTVQRTSRQRRVLLDTEIRLIDFGSATFNDEYHSSVVSTRHYRAPEIILNMGWTFPCDIWSIGCILVEFFTGDALFQTHDNLEHLAMMEAVCNSKIETKIVRSVQKQDYKGNANAAAKYFKGTKLDYPSKDTSKASKKYVNAMKKLTDIIPNNTPFNKNFLDLLKRIFVYDPNKRITAKQALEHPWFKDNLIDDGTEAVRLKLEEQMRREQEAGRF